jgi:hypothetical protein
MLGRFHHESTPHRKVLHAKGFRLSGHFYIILSVTLKGVFWHGGIPSLQGSCKDVGPNPTSLLPRAISLAETALRPFS